MRLLNCYVFDKSKKCFVFQHPSSDKAQPIDNSRHVRMEFSTDIDLVLHGFAGKSFCLAISVEGQGQSFHYTLSALQDSKIVIYYMHVIITLLHRCKA